MSLMGFANSLMLDFRCWVVPRFVYAVRTELPDGGSPQKAIVDRIEQLASASWRAGEALHPAVG